LRRTEVDLTKSQGHEATNYSIFYLPPGKYRGRTVIRNLETGVAAVASSTAILPAELEEGIRLYTPLLTIPKKDALYINISGIETEAGEKNSSVLSDIYAFDATQYSPLLGKIARETPELFVWTPGVVFESQRGVVKFYTRLVYEPTWEEIPMNILAQKKQGIFLFKVPTSELLPGRYYLYVFAEDQDTHAKANVNTSFVIE
jgi:hypothetical protein